ncbi:MAG TPA: serine hydrolase [Planctomycetota bacterium]|nr:serine hydrolase [Planctomycetota bacterium]
MRTCTRSLLLLLTGCAVAPAPKDAPLADVAADLRPFVARQVREMGLPGACIAVLDVDPATGREQLWSEGFGVWREAGSTMPADAVHRVASISKLFTDTAAMVLVERGQLDLDAPVRRYLPGFAPQNPFDTEVTLRTLMGHRAGIVRESPVGHYFDPTEPSLAATVQSLNDTALVHAPGSAYKYSNPGVGVVGEVVARVTGKPFEVAVRELVLAPLQLGNSDFTPRADLLDRQAHGVMWTYDGRAIPTPSFAFGYGPAANLRSSVQDLVHFAASWFPTAQRRVLQPATQASMWELPAGATSGCALGFFVRESEDGQLVVGHDGAVYGFASALRAVPQQGLAVAVVVTKDFANEVAEAIADRALAAASAHRRGEVLPPPSYPAPLGVAAARALAGHWRCGANWVELHERGGELFYDPNIGVRTRLRRSADGTLVSDDPLSIGGRRLRELPNGRLHDGQEEYVRDDAMPLAAPAELVPLLGEYGWDHDVLVVYEDRGQLAVLIEWVVRDLPERVGPDHYRFPPGMYTADQLVFERDAGGAVVAAVVGGARFVRRPGPEARGFRIAPLRPIAELVAEAAHAAPPPQPEGLLPFDLVELATLDPTLKFDVRYATDNNFLGTQVYPVAKAKMQRPAAEALLAAHRALAREGFGLCIFDAYRPWSVTKVFFEATPVPLRHFVADPSQGSRHNRGCAVDLTLYSLSTGEVVDMPSGYDEFTERAYPDYPGGTSRQRHCRELLRTAMEAAGFSVYEHEWWHFDFEDWQRYPVGNERLQ